ncbi:unnamed protein product [Aspergillus oryzae]|nr:unnamed protein product [Aspergillus oryzae]GMF92924.1 unnamed protein product [Aspergillus oryzae]GMG10762.1 unnamed protein product [Aspergillus oryzae]GMG45397.1 unnamed protein product [Aspergillus oryzae var. brunneus]
MDLLNLPTSFIDPNIIQSALRYLLQLKQWDGEQVTAFHSRRNTKAGCILQRFPGCGKTTDLAAIAIFVYHCGFAVAAVTGAIACSPLTVTGPSAKELTDR